MNILDYINQQSMTFTEFANLIKVTDVSVSRYARGLRYPRPAVMRRIVKATAGQVGPQDFFDQHAETASEEDVA